MNKASLLISVFSLFRFGQLNAANHSMAGSFNMLCLTSPGDTTKAKDTGDDEDAKTRTYAISLTGANDQARHGLVNQKQKLPYFEPTFTYTAKSGFYVGVGDQFLLLAKGKGGGFDVFDVNPGWDIDLTDNTTLNFNGQYYGFRKASVNLIESSMAEDVASYIEQDIGNLSLKFTAEYDFYNKVDNQPQTPGDIMFTPDVSYDFIIHFSEKSKLTFTPEFDLDLGTRNFITNYNNAAANDSAVSGQKVKVKSYAGNSNSSFGLVDYSFMLTVALKVGRFKLEPEISYCHPLYNSSPGQPNPAATTGSITMSYTIPSYK